MKAMILADLLTMKNRSTQYFLICGIMFPLVSFLTAGSPLLLLFIAPIWVTMSLQVFLNEETAHGWEGFRLALPISRNQVVVGRYASLALLASATTVLGILLCVVIKVVLVVFPILQQFTLWPEVLATEAKAFTLCFAIAIAGTLVLASLVLPFIMRFGSTGTMRYVPGIIMIVAMLAFYGASTPGVDLIHHGTLVFYSSEPSQALLLSLGILAAGSAFYVASATIAIRLYAKREF